MLTAEPVKNHPILTQTCQEDWLPQAMNRTLKYLGLVFCLSISTVVSAGNYIADPALRWRDKTIHYRFDAAVPQEYMNRVRRAMDKWEAVTTLRFVHDTGNVQANYTRVRINSSSNESCSSSLGMAGGEQHINLRPNYGCSQETIVHELGHTIGLAHEQQRYDRDASIRMIPGRANPSQCEEKTSPPYVTAKFETKVADN